MAVPDHGDPLNDGKTKARGIVSHLQHWGLIPVNGFSKGLISLHDPNKKKSNSNVFGIKMLSCSLLKWLIRQKHFRTKQWTEKRERWTSRPGKGYLHFFRPSPSSLCLISLLCCAFLEFQHWNCFWLLRFPPVLKSFDPRCRKLNQLLILYRSMTRLNVCNRI